MTTDIRYRDLNRSITAINAIPLNSTDPLNDQALVYDSTSQYLNPTNVIPLDSDAVLSGDKTFSGGVRFDANGDIIRRLNTMTVDVGNIGALGTATEPVTFSPAYSSVPRIYAQVQGGITARALNVVITDLTVNGCDVNVSNTISGGFTGLTVKLLIIEV